MSGDDLMKFDLHLHTSRHSPDSAMGPFDMCRRAEAIGLDGVVITEHDWLWTQDEVGELRDKHPDLVILSGVEVSAREGHFLAYGITNPFATPHGIGVADLCREVHRQGGAIVAAHPFRWRQPFNDILSKHRPALDGLELMTNNMDSGLPPAGRRGPQASGDLRPGFQRRPRNRRAWLLLHRLRRHHPRHGRPGRSHPLAPGGCSRARRGSRAGVGT